MNLFSAPLQMDCLDIEISLHLIIENKIEQTQLLTSYIASMIDHNHRIVELGAMFHSEREIELEKIKLILLHQIYTILAKNNNLIKTNSYRR